MKDAATRAEAGPFDPELSRWAPVAYWALAVVVVDQVLQVIGSVAGFGIIPSSWRFQFATSFAARVPPLAMAVLAALGVAAVTGNRRLVRGLSIGLGVVAVVIGLGLLSLWLDGPVVKRTVSAEDLTAFTSQWIRGLVISSVGLLVFGWFAIGSRKRL